MALLSAQDEQAVRARLAAIARPVTIVFFTQTFGAPETALAARQMLDEVVRLNDHLTLDEANFVLDKERAAQFGIDHVPGIALLAGDPDGREDTRLRFIGAPSGYEFMSLIDALVLAGTGSSGLTEASKALVAEHVTAPLHLQVFVTPTCSYCPRAVTLAHRMAVESPLITATCVEASEFIDLARKFRVTGVPKTVTTSGVEILGALPEDEFVRLAIGAPPA